MRNDLLTRLRVRLLRINLDEQLAQGVDPASNPALAVRAEQLLSGRAGLAAALERAAASAREPAPAYSASVPVRRAEVLDCEVEIQALVERLREPAPTDVRGVAMVSELLHDGAGPLYTDCGRTLRFALRSARLALDPIGDSFSEAPVAA